MNKQKMITALMSIAVLGLMIFVSGVQNANAQTLPPTVRIVVPERTRLLTGQFIDLRVEVAGISSSTARLRLEVENSNGAAEDLNYSGPLEVTSDNDNLPTLDKAWTYRKVAFNTPGIKTITAVLVDGRRIYGVATQISVQNFNLAAQKNIVLFIGDAMGTAYRPRVLV